MDYRPEQQDNLEGRIAALAQVLREEGQSNLAKLLEAGAYARFQHAGWKIKSRLTRTAISDELREVIDQLKSDRFEQEYIAALESSSRAMDEGKIPLYEDAPDPYVCRLCGFLVMNEPPERCPECGTRRWGFRRFVGTYNVDTPDPLETLEILREMPGLLKRLAAGVPDLVATRQPSGGGWTVYEAVTHLHDSQQVLLERLERMLSQDNPELVSMAVFDQATRVQDKPLSLLQLLEVYAETRQKLVQRLESIPLKDWWRPGRHTEYGQVNILHQAGYFAAHEVFHLPQIEQGISSS